VKLMRLTLTLCAALLALPVLAETPANTPEGVLAEAAADCAAAENGVFSAAEGAVTEVDLTGDVMPDYVVSAAYFDCSTMASLWGGTGGAPIFVLANGQRRDATVLDWKVVPFEEEKVLLMWVHGSQCYVTGALACFDTMVFGLDGFAVPRPVSK